MTANELLERIRNLNRRIPLNLKRIASLRNSLSIAAPSPDADHICKSKNVDAMSARVAAIVDLERETDELTDELIDLKNTLLIATKGLSDPLEALVITEHFIEGKSADVIAEENTFSQRWIYKIIRRSTEHLDHILAQKEDTSVQLNSMA